MTNPTKSTDLQGGQRDPDLANALIALKWAARKVRENAQKTGVPVVYYERQKDSRGRSMPRHHQHRQLTAREADHTENPPCRQGR